MLQYYGVIVLLALGSFIATIEYVLLKARVEKTGKIGKCMKKYAFHTFSLFFAAFYFVLSAVKFYLGYHKENLFESFWNVQAVTFVHYGIPIIIMAVIAPVILSLIFCRFEWKIIRFFDSVMFFSFAFVYFCVRKISNRTYCVAFLIALIVTLAAVFYVKKNEIIFVSDGNKKKQLLGILPFVLYWGVLVAFYTPNELYLNNADDFPMSYSTFFGKLLLSCVIWLIILMAGMLLYLTEKQKKIFCTVLFAFLTMGYIQGMFLNGDMGALDGSQQAWDSSKLVLNAVIWIVVISIILFLAIWRYEKSVKLMRVISIWIVLTQMVSLGVLVLSSEGTEAKSELLLTTDGMLEVGEENNIIVFVLDMFDGRRMDDILEKSPDFLEPLQDFTYYRNTTSEFCPTYNSIPFLLTGTEFREDFVEEYISYAYEGDTLFKDLYNNGYDIGIYTHERYVPQELEEMVSNYQSGVERTCKMWELHSLMTQCSRYNMAPFFFKDYYIYDTSDIALLVVDDRITNIEDDLPFYHRLIENKLYVTEDTTRKGTFRFIHMHGAHAPYTMTEDFQHLDYDVRRDTDWHGDGDSQAKGAMKIVYEYMEQLKLLGKYDDATIIITSDHGETNEIYDEAGNAVSISFPIMFVKESEEKHEEIIISEAPVCHADIIPTIKKNMGMNVGEKTLSEYTEQDKRVRTYRESSPGYYEKWEATGNVREYDSWKWLFEKSDE